MPKGKHTNSPCRTPAWGIPRKGMLSAHIAFEAEMFAEIRALAVRNNTSFAEQVRTLVEWGLLDVKEAA